MQYRKLLTNADCHEWCRIVSVANPASSPWMCDLGINRVWDVLSAVAEMAWDVLSGAAKMAWDVLSGLTKTEWDVLSRVANRCGMFCPGCQKLAWDVLSRDVLSFIQWHHIVLVHARLFSLYIQHSHKRCQNFSNHLPSTLFSIIDWFQPIPNPSLMSLMKCSVLLLSVADLFSINLSIIL